MVTPDAFDVEALKRRRRRRRWGFLLLLWVGLLVASNIWQAGGSRLLFRHPPSGSFRAAATIPEMTADGPRPSRQAHLSYLRWTPASGAATRPPIILLHGSPGHARHFAALAPRLTAAGFDVIAPDLPGFGRSERWVGDYSLEAHARSILALMDALGVPRAHVIGWSLGGGVGVVMADLAPDRLASLTMLASIGIQEAEGSGDYYFEHVKYAIGFALLVALPEAIPHFGALADRAHRHALVRSFWDSDQRTIRHRMERLSTPTLIIHGRRDFLVPAWGAETHHALIPTSRLVILNASHFLPLAKPLGQADQITQHIVPFLSRHDDPANPPLRSAADFAPMHGEAKVGRFHIRQGAAWWIILLIIVIGTFITEDGTVIAVGLAIAHGQIDLGVGVIACFVGIALGDGGLWLIGRVFGRRVLRWRFVSGWVSEKSLERWGRWFDKHTIQAVFLARVIPGTRLPTYLAAGLLSRKTHGFLLWAAVAAFLWTPIILALVIALGPHVLEALLGVFSGPVAAVISVVLLLIALRTLTYVFTWEGRRRLLRDALLPWKPEFWPMWLFYIPVIPWVLFLAIRHRGPMTFTCINPGIPHGGGVVGESKSIILSRFAAASDWIVPTALIDAGEPPALRAQRVHNLLQHEPRFAGYPVILKPDEAQRGHGFKVIRSLADAETYFTEMTRPALLQMFHPGPHEVGILWAREPGQRRGRIFSITRKRFPSITGDGSTTLDRLIWKHPRFRMQAETFLKRFDAMRDRVLASGESMSLATAGNHCQGTMFLDGSDLITPELERRIDEIALSFDREGFDFGRFDIRFASEDDLRAGRGFSIIEVNGAMSESTNMYDPRKPVWWTYRVLFRQWRVMFELGRWRRASGVRPMRLRELLAAIRDHFRGRPGSAVAD